MFSVVIEEPGGKLYQHTAAILTDTRPETCLNLGQFKNNALTIRITIPTDMASQTDVTLNVTGHNICPPYPGYMAALIPVSRESTGDRTRSMTYKKCQLDTETSDINSCRFVCMGREETLEIILRIFSQSFTYVELCELSFS